jgi:hypothetical protein
MEDTMTKFEVSLILTLARLLTVLVHILTPVARLRDKCYLLALALKLRAVRELEDGRNARAYAYEAEWGDYWAIAFREGRTWYGLLMHWDGGMLYIRERQRFGRDGRVALAWLNQVANEAPATVKPAPYVPGYIRTAVGE